MRIPRPKARSAEFRRRRAPPPQATKLLLASLGAGLVFMGLLALVFVPRYLEYVNQPPVAILELRLNTSAGLRVDVVGAAFALGLSKFNATLERDNVTIARLAPGLQAGGADLSFADANGDGLINPGDYFVVSTSAEGRYRLQVWQVDVNRRVGLLEWQGTLP